MKIIAPNKNYTGISAGVAFAKGIGECNDPRTIEWFKNHGYSVTENLLEDDNDEIEALKTELETVKSNFVAAQIEHDKTLVENESLKSEIEALKAKCEKTTKK